MVDVCAASGTPRRSMYRWLENQPDFRAEVEEARAKGRMVHVTNIRRAGTTDWRASAWFLERQDPDNWARSPASEEDLNDMLTAYKHELQDAEPAALNP